MLSNQAKSPLIDVMFTNAARVCWRIEYFGRIIVGLLIIAFLSSGTQAQITLDGTTGAAGTLAGPDYRIDADFGQQRGANLFHSFGMFNINTGESATFTGPSSVANIISRVTGGSVSWIDGLLCSEIPGANLFLLNPAGVMFGPAASLDISGSFHVSTADYLRLGQDGRFDAREPSASLLTTANPSAFGFLSGSPAPITFQGSGSEFSEIYLEQNGITLPEGETLSVIGGEVRMTDGVLFDTYPVESRLRAPGGRINIASVASAGEVIPTDSGLEISVCEEQGRISLTRGSKLDVGGNAGGEIYIRGGEFVIKDQGSSVSAVTVNGDAGDIDIRMAHDMQITGGGEILSTTLGDGKGGDISISAESLTVSDYGAVGANSGTFIFPEDGEMSEGVLFAGNGQGGEVTLNLNRLEIRNGALFTNTLGSGKAGDISISAEAVSVADDGVITSDNGFVILEADQSVGKGTVIGGKGESGRITLHTEKLEMNQGAISSNTLGNGAGGNISIIGGESFNISGSGTNDPEYPPDFHYGISSQARGSGNGGNITIETDQLDVSQDAMINCQTYGPGQGGDVTLDTTRLEIHQGGTITTSTRGAGPAGAVSITADESVSLSGSGAKLDKSRIYTATHSGGRGGNLSISTDSLSIGKDGEIFAKTLGDDTWDGNTLPDGRGGDIELNAARLRLTQGGLITAGSESRGDAGNITVSSSETVTLDNASVMTSTEQSDGGDIIVKAENMLRLSGSTLTTSVKGGEGDGGNITVDPEFVILNRSKVIANAHGGDGGNIYIASDQLIRSSDSVVDASSTLGIDGQIYIESPEADLTGAITALPENYTDASRWLKTPCSARTGEDVSRFVIGPRDALPARHDDWLASPPPAFGDTELSEIRDDVVRQAMIRAETFHRKGAFESAVRIWEGVILRVKRESRLYVHTLAYLSDAYQALGHHQKALSAFSEALPVIEAGDDLYCKALFFSALGDLYLSLGDRENAETYLKKGLDAARISQQPGMQASALNNMGNLRAAQKDDHGAMNAFKKSLGIAEALPELKSAILLNMIRLTLQSVTPEKQAFISASDNAWSHIRTLPDSHNKARDLLSLSLLVSEIRKAPEIQNNPRADTRLREIVLGSLEHAKQIAGSLRDNRIASYAYGYLGRLYETEARYPEALALTRKALFLAQRQHSPEISYLWYWQTGRLFRAEGEIGNAIAAYGHAIATLNPIRGEFYNGYRSRKQTFYEQVKPVYIGLADLLLLQSPEREGKDKEKILRDVTEVTELLKTAELEDFYRDECVTAAKKKGVSPDTLPARAAILYPISLPDRLALLLMLPGGMKHVTVSADSDTLGKTAREFHKRLQNPGNNRFRYHAKHLYDWLIRPVEADLISANTDTLIVVPDGVLRTIPFSALHDGKHFLIEKYAVATIPGLTLTDFAPAEPHTTNHPQQTTNHKPHTLLNGLSEAREGFAPLPYVKEELRNIRQTTGGRILQDQDYTIGNLRKEMRNNAYSVIHIATHGRFGATPEETFLLAYNGRLTMDRLGNLIGLGRFRDVRTELLTLSACQTASGNQRAALGLAGVALKAGARSAIATLWLINDKAASLLISEFYRQFKTPGISKAKALQNAQKMFAARDRYRHPYYWSPFLLIGNWL